MKADIADRRTDLTSEVAEVRNEVSRLAVTLSLAMIASITTFGGLLIAAAAIFKP